MSGIETTLNGKDLTTDEKLDVLIEALKDLTEQQQDLYEMVGDIQDRLSGGFGGGFEIKSFDS